MEGLHVSRWISSSHLPRTPCEKNFRAIFGHRRSRAIRATTFCTLSTGIVQYFFFQFGALGVTRRNSLRVLCHVNTVALQSLQFPADIVWKSHGFHYETSQRWCGEYRISNYEFSLLLCPWLSLPIARCPCGDCAMPTRHFYGLRPYN